MILYQIHNEWIDITHIHNGRPQGATLLYTTSRSVHCTQQCIVG